jgi:hypothetical protein
MQDTDGHFYYRLYPIMKARTPMLHWAQATIFRGLAVLLARLRSQSTAPAHECDLPNRRSVKHYSCRRVSTQATCSGVTRFWLAPKD